MTSRPVARWFLCVGAASFLAVFAVGGGTLLWYFHRPQPTPVLEQLAPGVTYERKIQETPRPLVIHTVTVDLTNRGLAFVVTPPDRKDALPLFARTTSQFAEEFNVDIAINASAFSPWRTGWFDAYPTPGDPVHLHGYASAGGTPYGLGAVDERTVQFFGSAIQFGPPLIPGADALSGMQRILDGGAVTTAGTARHPRTALGHAPGMLWLVVIDGRQPNYSEGVTLPELAQYLKSLGATDAINLDGGGSSTLVIHGTVKNSPINGRIPGSQRPVANHVGVRL